MGNIKDNLKGKGIDRTLNNLSVGQSIPKSLYVLLILLYIIASFLVRSSSMQEGAISVIGRPVPITTFTGVFSALANIAIILLVTLYRKVGYITAMLFIFLYQFPSLVITFLFRGNVTGLAGIFSNIFTLVTITVIFLMDRKNFAFQQRLHYQAVTDRLTKLPNRFACTELMESLINDGEKFSIATVDISNFKSINDTMGHEFGDKILIEIANRWRALADSGKTGTNDFVARLGGDEYAVIIRDYDEEEAVMNTILAYKESLEAKTTIDDCDYYLSAHFGYASYPGDGNTPDALLSGSNAALHEVNRQGTGMIMKYTEELHRKDRTMEIERKIRTALDNNTVFFNLQPQYDLSHKLRGFEALARMKDEEGNFISPGDFIPVAEKTGLVDQIDTRVFTLAADFLSKVLKEKKSTDMTISVNVSVRHLMKNNFIEETRDILNRYSIPPQNIEIEITESIMIDSTEKALNCINELKEMGIKIAIDDFGTGYSSLSYLNNLPSDLLKIDKSFIDVMNDSESSKKYVATIISIGHILNLEVISEGVESDEQIATLRSVGCDFIQGFVWGRPLPPEEAMELALAA